MTKPLRKIAADEFARRLRATSEEADKRFALFLGAGCSVSSGIPAAGNLVKDDWLPRLREVCAPLRKDLDVWTKEEFPEYDPENPATLYGAVMERLFFSPEERQREIERLCDGKFPGFGYACTANLVALDGGRFNVVLTTNFDDLVADALYLYTQARPLVIQHESLASYIRPTRTRPLVVKLHGDHRLSPQNTAQETEALKEEIEKHVRTLLHDRGLIFIGYGGNDQGIKKMLEALPTEALPLGVYWVSHKEPQGTIRSWLDSRRAIWVEKGDFDELMLLIRDSFDLPHPDRNRFDKVFEKYNEKYRQLSGRIISLPDSAPGAAALKKAVKRTDESLPGWLVIRFEADRLEQKDPDGANVIYAAGVKRYPDSAPLLGDYALFLYTIRKDYSQAEEHFRRALAADPNNATNLGNYANFLTIVRKDHDHAEEYYQRAFAIDPKNSARLGNYALFLYTIRKEHNQAEEYFRRALAADPNDGDALGRYALFLYTIRKDYSQAEEHFRRALAADPNHANNLGNYALFLEEIHKDYNQAEEHFRRALTANPNHADVLGNYAAFLYNVRQDFTEAEEYFRRAMAANPNHPVNLGNYAGFLLGRGNTKDGLSVLEKVLALPDTLEASTLAAECWFYAFAHRPIEGRAEALRNLKRVLQAGARSPGWNLTDNIAQAEKDGHADTPWLKKLAAVITEGADIKTLDSWEDWKKA